MLVLGHRGASRAAPENTPAAFLLADRLGADGVELDVRLGADGRPIVHHDPLPADRDALDALPALGEALDACGDRMLVNVEIKSSEDDPASDLALVDATLDELARRGEAHAHRWLVSSFSWAAIEECRRRSPRVPTGFLVVDAGEAEIERTAAAGHRAIHPWVTGVTVDVVERCHAAGLLVNTWTCNDPTRLVELAALGVDGVYTDVPDVALAALGRSDGRPAVSPQWGTPA